MNVLCPGQEVLNKETRPIATSGKRQMDNESWTPDKKSDGNAMPKNQADGEVSSENQNRRFA